MMLKFTRGWPVLFRERLKRSYGTYVSIARMAPKRHSRGATPRAPLASAGGPVLDRRRSASRLQAGDDRVGDLAGTDGGWIVAGGLHVLGHLPSLAGRLRDGCFQHCGRVGLGKGVRHHD